MSRTILIAAAIALASRVAWAAPVYINGVPTTVAPANTCLVIDNARANNAPLTVEIDGFSGYWVLGGNQTYTIVSHTPPGTPENSGEIIRGSRFNFSVYDGDERQGSKGALYDSVSADLAAGPGYGTSSHTWITLIEPPTSNDQRADPACRQTGYWLALVHD